MTTVTGRHGQECCQRCNPRSDSHPKLFPRVSFIVTNLPLQNRAVVRFFDKRGTAEPWMKEGKQGAHRTPLSCHRFRANAVRLQLSVFAYNLGNGWAAGEARALLLAPAGREPPDPTPVRGDASTDLSLAGAGRLTGELGRRSDAERAQAGKRCPRNVPAPGRFRSVRPRCEPRRRCRGA